MRRRIFIAAVGSVPFWSFDARAQKSVVKLGVLLGNSPDPRPLLTALESGLRDLGYVEDRNIVFERRWANPNLAELTPLAEQLAALKVDAVYATPTSAATAAKNVIKDIPIVVSAADPVGTGLVASLSRPGGNVTGVSTAASELGAKNLELMREILPSVRRVAVLVNPGDPFNTAFLEHVREAARVLDIEITSFSPRNPADLEQIFVGLDKIKVEAVIAQPSLPQTDVAKLSLERRLPAFVPHPSFAAVGGLMSYSSDLTAVGRDAAAILDKVLKGRKPADLPVELPSKFWLAVNLKTAKALGINVPGMLLTRADEVIE
jgi:putative ABC transport system substrate-binding protein